MGNYESLKTGARVEVEVIGDDYQSAFLAADDLLKRALAADLENAGEITDVRNSYILTWAAE